MDKQQARQIIKETLEKPFDKGRFTGFVRNLLNHIEDAPFTYQGTYIPEKFRPYIKTLERIGKFSDGEHSLDILVITLQKETSLERARTMQRNFIAWYLNGSRGGELKDAALVAYVSPQQADWRFSLVKMDYKFEKTASGKVKVRDEFTPARRWSFLVGLNEKSHTAQSRLVNILADDEHNPTLAQLEEAFNIETVTKEFFLKYRELFLRTKEALDRVVQDDPKVRADFEAKGVDTVNFAKKLLGQIVFLYFLQKKGWFGVGRDDDWGTGSKHFLRQLFEGTHGSYKNFFNDILEPLFYEALRIDRSHDDDYYSRFNCKIPFLNGGLFDPIGNYDWVHTDIHLPNDLFSNSRKTKEGDEGDGILDVFDRYNFTVREDEPLEKEVAIDPELLGKAYEKFNAIRPDNFDEFIKALKSGNKGEENKFNKKFGVYYTPREIVHYMCKQSLINYLYTQAEAAGLSDTIKKQDIEKLIEVGELITEHEATALIKQEKIKNGIQKSTEYTALLADSIRKNAAAIDKWLEDITVCDPAVGSGAFPVGMMTEIVRARNVLSVFLSDGNRNDYEFKRRCIEHSLYGVDIDPGAVEIAKLRLWLSLVVDEENVKNIKPLPNLDYKIVCGNSLLGVEKDLFNHQLFTDLEKLKPLYFNETNPTKKQEYKKKIDELISQITKGHTEFDFEVYFSEVFHEKGGFDVVIANPPYVLLQAENRDDTLLKYYKMSFSVVSYKVDLYHLFIEKGILLLRKGACITYITPSNFCTNNYSVSLRRFLLTRTWLQSVLTFSEDVFEASVNNLVFIALNDEAHHLASYSGILADGTLIMKEKAIVKQSILISEKCILIPPKTPESLKVIRKIEENNEKLGAFATVNFGMQLRDRKKYMNDVIEGPIVKSKLSKYHRPCYTGKDIQRFRVSFNDRYCFFNRVAKRGGCWNEAIHNSKGKILVRQVGAFPEGGIDEEGYAVLNTAFMIVPFLKNISSKLLLAFINSSVVRFYWENKFKDDRKTFPKIKGEYLKQIPIPHTVGQQESLIALVDKILAITKDDDYLQNPAKQAQVKEYEKQIDQMVYELYGLTEEEIKIVEGRK